MKLIKICVCNECGNMAWPSSLVDPECGCKAGGEFSLQEVPEPVYLRMVELQNEVHRLEQKECWLQYEIDELNALRS